MAKTRRVAAGRFYADALDAAEQAEFAEALTVDGIEEEIALLRLRLRRFVQEHPEDLPLLFRGVELLSRVVGTKYRLSKQEKAAVKSSMQAVLGELDRLWPLKDAS